MRHWVAIPNFVDTAVFRPAVDAAEQAACRRKRGLPAEAFVIGCVAALKRDHKRVDYLIREVASMSLSQRHREHREEAFLLLAGATTEDTPVVERLAEELLPGRHRIMRDLPRSEMPDLYRCMDVFVLPSLFEMMPIAVLEAMASEVPVLVNNHHNLAWMIGEATESEGGTKNAEVNHEDTKGTKVMVGSRSSSCPLCLGGSLRASPARGVQEDAECRTVVGGMTLDMQAEGALASAVAGLTAGNLRDLGGAARLRAEHVFSKQVVIEEYVRYYRQVVERMR